MRLLPLALLLGCGPSDDAADPSPAEPTYPDLVTSGCGLPDYTWQPLDDMGTLLDWEPVPEASLSAESLTAFLDVAGLEVFSPVPYGIDVYRVRYLTQDRGERVEATGLVAFPAVAASQSFPTLLWVRPTVGFTDDCALSGRPFPDPLGQTVLAAFGYVVVAPDLLGMNGWGEPAGFLHPYAVPEPTAVAALDSVRALWHLDAELGGDAPADAEHRAVFWGASEGGFGALWADRYAAEYLPEAEVSAVVAAVPPTDMLGIAQGGVTEFQDATEGLAAVLATSRLWYGETTSIDTLLTDTDPLFLASRLEEALAGSCSGAENPMDAAQSVAEVYQADFIAAVAAGDWDAVAPWSCYLQTGQLSESPIPRGTGAPVLYQVSEDDTLVLGYTGRADAPRLCDGGYELEYLECAGADHVSGAAESLPYQVQWVADRLAGEPIAQPCVIGPPVDCTEFGLDVR